MMPSLSTSGGMWVTVPVVLVSTRLTRSRLRARPKSEIFAQKPWAFVPRQDVSRMLPARREISPSLHVYCCNASNGGDCALAGCLQHIACTQGRLSIISCLMLQCLKAQIRAEACTALHVSTLTQQNHPHAALCFTLSPGGQNTK